MIHAAPTQSALSAEGPSNPVPRPIVKDRAHGNDDGQRDGQGAAEVLALPFASVLQGLQQSLAPVSTLEVGKESSPATGGHPGEAARPAKDPLTSTGVVLAGGAWALPVDLPAEQRRQVGSDAIRSDLPRPSGDGEATNREEPLRSGADLAEPAPTEAEPGPTIAGRPAPLAIPFEVPDTRHVVAYDVADPATARRHAPTPVDGAPTATREGIPSMESAGDKVQPDLAEKHATPPIDRHRDSQAPGTSTSGWRAVATSSGPLRASTPGASHGAAIIHPELPGHQAPNHARPPSPSPDAAPSASSIVASDDANLTSPHEQTDDGNATRGNDGANTGYLLRNPSAGPRPDPAPSETSDVTRLVPAQVLQQIVSQPLSVGTMVVIRLDPPLLGSVVLRVVAGDGKRIRLHFQVEEPDVGDALAGSLEKLESALRAQGLSPEGVSVSLASAQTAGDSSTGSGPRPFVRQQSGAQLRIAHVARRDAPTDARSLVQTVGGRYIDFLL